MLSNRVLWGRIGGHVKPWGAVWDGSEEVEINFVRVSAGTAAIGKFLNCLVRIHNI